MRHGEVSVAPELVVLTALSPFHPLALWQVATQSNLLECQEVNFTSCLKQVTKFKVALEPSAKLRTIGRAILGLSSGH